MLNNEKEWSFDCNIYTFAKILLIITRESNNFFICNKVLHSEKVRNKMSGARLATGRPWDVTSDDTDDDTAQTQ